MTDITTLLNNSIELYIKSFNSYIGQFLQWGEILFFGCVVISVVWISMWRAFASESLHLAMPMFLQEFFIIAFFYTLMINALPWLSSILQSAIVMGTSLSHQQVDPASIIAQGISLANKMLIPLKNTGILQHLFGATLMLLAYVLILFAFFAVALDLAVTLIVISFLVALASFSLAFAALGFTRKIAYNTIDAIIAKSMKLVALYIVIGISSGILTNMANYLPTDKVTNFDVYSWVVATCLLFWLITKEVSQQVLSVFSNNLNSG